MSSPICRTESPSLDEHAKRKWDERDALEKQAGGVLSTGAEPEADAEAVPPKKIKPEVEGTAVSKAEVKHIQRNLKTMPLEDSKNSEGAEHQNKDMEDMDSDRGSNADAVQDNAMEESSQQPLSKTDTPDDSGSTPSSEGGDQETESANTTIHSIINDSNGSEARSTSKHTSELSSGSSSKPGRGFLDTSAASPFANVKPGESVFGSSSSTLKGQSATSTASPFASVEKTDVFGGSKSPSIGFGNASASPFTSTASSTNVFGGGSAENVFGGGSAKSVFGGGSVKSVFGGESTKSVFGGESTKSVFGGESTKSVFGGESAKSVFGQSSSTSSSAFGATSGNSNDSTAGSVFGTRSVVGSVVGSSPSHQATSALTGASQSTSSSSFSTFGAKNSFAKEASFTSGSFIDQESGQDKADFGSLLSQDVGENDGDYDQAERDEHNVGTGVFTNVDQIDVQTGEEEEVNVYQTKGKLYADTEKTHSWKERGKGTFRINVSRNDTKLARLVMRTDGVLRLILNVSIFPEMNAVITGDKYVRFIGIEDEKPIPFLLKVKDATVAQDIVEGIERAMERQARRGTAVTLRE